MLSELNNDLCRKIIDTLKDFVSIRVMSTPILSMASMKIMNICITVVAAIKLQCGKRERERERRGFPVEKKKTKKYLYRFHLTF